MASTGNVFPGTGENNSGIGATAWTNPSNILSDNASDATCAAGASSQYLVARNFGLSIPSGATINGITVRVEASEHSAGNETLNVRLQDESGTLVGTGKTATLSGTGKVVYTLGGTSDVWGATLTDSIVNDADFGVRLWFTTSHDVRIDYVTLAVEYTEAAAGGFIFPDPVFPIDVFPGPVFPTGDVGLDVTVEITGNAATGAAGTPGVDHTNAVSGEAATSAVGSLAVESQATENPTGVAATSAVGTAVPNTEVSITGNGLTGAVGSVGAAVESNITVNITGVAGTVSLGAFGQDYLTFALTGHGLTADEGTLAPEFDQAISGNGATAGVGTVTFSQSAALTGATATAEAGFTTAGNDVRVTLAGVSAGVGTVGTLGAIPISTAAVRHGGVRVVSARYRGRPLDSLEAEYKRMEGN